MRRRPPRRWCSGSSRRPANIRSATRPSGSTSPRRPPSCSRAAGMLRCFMFARNCHAGRVIDAAGAKAARLKLEAERAAEIARRLQKLADEDSDGDVDETPAWQELVKLLKDCG